MSLDEWKHVILRRVMNSSRSECLEAMPLAFQVTIKMSLIEYPTHYRRPTGSHQNHKPLGSLAVSRHAD